MQARPDKPLRLSASASSSGPCGERHPVLHDPRNPAPAFPFPLTSPAAPLYIRTVRRAMMERQRTPAPLFHPDVRGNRS